MTYRSREYLDFARGQTCIRCCSPDAVSAHYSGKNSHWIGKGGALKVADLVSAHLCDNCHTYFDSYQGGGNNDTRAAEFLMLCWMTLLRNIEQEKITLSCKPTKYRKGSTDTPAKVLPR